MEWIAAFLTDTANWTQDGKLNLCGIFSEQIADSLPHAMFATLVVLMKTEPMDRNRVFDVMVDVVNQDGRSLHRFTDLKMVAGDMQDARSLQSNMYLTMRNFLFPDFGDYRFEVYMEGEHRGGVGVRIRPR